MLVRGRGVNSNVCEKIRCGGCERQKCVVREAVEDECRGGKSPVTGNTVFGEGNCILSDGKDGVDNAEVTARSRRRRRKEKCRGGRMGKN